MVRTRSLNLLGLWIAASLRRLRYDWVRELVVFICGGIFIALAIYLAHDFLHIELGGIPSGLFDKLRLGASLVLWLVLWTVAAKSFAYELTNPESISHAALRLGETRQTVRQFQHLRITCLFIVVSATFCTVSTRFFHAWSPQAYTLLCASGLALSTVLGRLFWLRDRRKPSDADPHASRFNLFQSMMRWRMGQILLRNRLTQLCTLCCGLGCLMIGILAYNGAPFLLLSLFSFLSGCFLSMTIAFQAQEDMKQAWFERHLGVSHSAYLNALLKTALALGLVFALTQGLLLAAVLPVLPLDVIKAPVSLLIPVLMMPYLVLQIDPQRPWIQAIVAVLIGIIIATAWYAHWLGIGALFVFNYFAAQQCDGRYYRA